MLRGLKRASVLAPALFLAACGSLLPDTGPAPNIYTLRAAAPAKPDLPAVDWQLVIEEPLTPGHLNTDRIAVQPTAFELKYYPDARWSERAPAMVQRRMIEAYANTGKIPAVGSELLGLRADYRLKSELREFAARYADGSGLPSAYVRLRLTLLGKSREDVIGVQEIESRIPARSDRLIDVVAAFDQSLGEAIAMAVDWTLRAPARFTPQPAAPAPAIKAPASKAPAVKAPAVKAIAPAAAATGSPKTP